METLKTIWNFLFNKKTNRNMEYLIKRLEKSVAFAEAEIEGEDMNDVSWEMQEGILISYNEAKVVIEALKAFKISSNKQNC